MTTPTQGNRIPEGSWWAADNGKFGRHYVGDISWFAWLCAKVRAYGSDKCLFAVAPDVPFDAAATLACSLKWLAMIRTLDIPAAFCAQDGSEAPGMIPWDEFDTLFIAGSDQFKEGEHARALAAEAKARGKAVHVGRVNSRRRMNIAESYGADSCDGTYLRYGPDKNLPVLLGWLGLDPAAADASAAKAEAKARPLHWHPRLSSTISAADGRIHAPESYRTHLIHGVACDEHTCEVCIHDCTCARCTGWCRCDRPPNAPTPGGAVRFNDDGRLSKEGLLALADDIAEALGPPWEHDRTNHTYWRTELVCPDDDWRISIEVAPGRHKATATGLTPTLAGRWWRDSDKARIGFTATRDPEAIAADLRRRLFPPYAHALIVERAGIAVELARREHFGAAAARLQTHLPASGHRDRDVNDCRFHTYWTDRHGSHNRASLDNSGDTVHLDLRQVPLEVACALIDVVEGRVPSRRPGHRRGTGPRRHARRRATRRSAQAKAVRP
ncbi:hypothetical protein [Catenulispora yoronensis]